VEISTTTSSALGTVHSGWEHAYVGGDVKNTASVTSDFSIDDLRIYHEALTDAQLDVIRQDAQAWTEFAEYTYDVYDRRIAKRIDDGAGSVHKEHYIYDLPTGADDKILLRFVEDDQGVAHLTNRYLHGPAVDQVLADEQYEITDDPYNEEGDVLWALTDNLGSVRDLVSYDDVAGETVMENHITYDAFGRTIAETVPGTNLIYTYTGREYDPETGNYYYRARYYDPDTGRFLSEDPIAFAAGDSNLSRYVGNDPVNYTDPSGNRKYKEYGFFQAISDFADAVVMAGSDLVDGRPIRSLDAYVYDSVGYEAKGSYLSAADDGAAAGLLKVGDNLTFRQIDGLHDETERIWKETGMKGTWVEDATDVSSYVAGGAAAGAATIVAGPAVLAGGAKVLRGSQIVYQGTQALATNAGIQAYVYGGTALAAGSRVAPRVASAVNDKSIRLYIRGHDLVQKLPAAATNPWTYSIGLGGTAYYATDGDWNATRDAAALPILIAPERAAQSLAGINVDRILAQYPKFNFRNYRPAGAYSGFPIPTYNAPDKWSRLPRSTMDQMVLDAAKRGKGDMIIKNLNDPQFKGMEKWSYGETSGAGLRSEVHYVRDPATGKLFDFKFKHHAETYR
jgi:RHS repeat-associated protein